MWKISILIASHLSFALLAGAQEKRAFADIRQIDFRNFRYPWRAATSPGDFQWLTKFDATVSVRDGAHVFKAAECGRSCPELSISEVFYTDVNADFIQDAIIVLNYSTGALGVRLHLYDG
jgi:hypothetical protein